MFILREKCLFILIFLIFVTLSTFELTFYCYFLSLLQTGFVSVMFVPLLLFRWWRWTGQAGGFWWTITSLTSLASRCWATTSTGRTGSGGASSACTSAAWSARSSSTSCPTSWASRPHTSSRPSVRTQGHADSRTAEVERNSSLL